MYDLLQPPMYSRSRAVRGMSYAGDETVVGTGDMWPITWAADDNLYAAAGDNSGFQPYFQTMNFWRIEGVPPSHNVVLVNDLRFLKAETAESEIKIPPIKPAGVISVDRTLYLAVEDMRYTDGRYGNQINLQGWIIYSNDFGHTWSEQPQPGTPARRFLDGVFASPHFLQFGKDYSDARDNYVYAYSCAGDDGIAAWSAGDHMYLARVPKDAIIERNAWEFFCGSPSEVRWSRDLARAVPVFSYPKKTGENEVVFHRGLGRCLLLNWCFIDCTNHRIGSLHSELSIFEAPEPWGPWETVYLERDWGKNCDYQPRLPTKWMHPASGSAWLVSAGNFWQKGGRSHYAFVTIPVNFGSGDYGAAAAYWNEPANIADFRVYPVSDTEIGLSWTPVRGVGFYRIERDGKKLTDIAPCYPGKYIDTEVKPASSHEYRVVAYSPAGDPERRSEGLSATSLPAHTSASVGVNLAGKGVIANGEQWFGEDSVTHFRVVCAGEYRDQRIANLAHVPAPNGLGDLLTAIRGEIPGVKIVFRSLAAGTAQVTVIYIQSKLSTTTCGFDLWIQERLVDAVEDVRGDYVTWRTLGPYEVEVNEAGEVIVEGRNFRGLGGLAAVRVQPVEGLVTSKSS